MIVAAQAVHVPQGPGQVATYSAPGTAAEAAAAVQPVLLAQQRGDVPLDELGEVEATRAVDQG